MFLCQCVLYDFDSSTVFIFNHCACKNLKIVVSFQDLLERIYRLFDPENEGYLVQEDWFEFLKQRLT